MLKRITLALLLLLVLMFISIETCFADVFVDGYLRKDGTYVAPYFRSDPDGNPYNNWSFPGNTNPYTGEVASGNPDTYLKNHSIFDSIYSVSGLSSYLQSNEASTYNQAYNSFAKPSYTTSASNLLFGDVDPLDSLFNRSLSSSFSQKRTPVESFAFKPRFESKDSYNSDYDSLSFNSFGSYSFKPSNSFGYTNNSLFGNSKIEDESNISSFNSFGLRDDKSDNSSFSSFGLSSNKSSTSRFGSSYSDINSSISKPSTYNYNRFGSDNDQSDSSDSSFSHSSILGSSSNKSNYSGLRSWGTDSPSSSHSGLGSSLGDNSSSTYGPRSSTYGGLGTNSYKSYGSSLGDVGSSSGSSHSSIFDSDR